MACTITITSAVVSGGNVIVSGSFSASPPCSPGPLTITVKVNCNDPGGIPLSCSGTGTLTSGSTFWQASVPCNCACGPNSVAITAQASCSNPVFNCSSAPFVLSTLCCCPSATTSVSNGACSGSTQLVSFSTIVSIADNCLYTFRRDFGDGNFGANHTFNGPGTFNLPLEQHNYAAPGTYTSNLDVLPPPFGCGTISSVAVTANCGGCFSSSSIAALCKFLEWLFLVSMTVGLGIGFSQPCIPLPVAAVFILTGIVALFFFLLLQCQLCICDFFLKYWGIIFIATGFVNIMFIPPACAVVTGWAAATNSLIFFSLGFAILSIWYFNNKLTCPLIICDFWCAVAGPVNITSATGIAIIAVLTMWVLSGFVLTAGMVLALLAITTVAALIGFGPLSNPPCNNNTQNCQ